MSMLKLFAAARHVSVPFIAIRTADQFATIEALKTLQDEVAKGPVVQWDAVRGLTGADDVEDKGKTKFGKGSLALAALKIEVTDRTNADAVKKALADVASETINFVDAMDTIRQLPRLTVACVHNAHRQLFSQEPIQTASAVQAIANLRNVLKRNWRTLVLLAPHFVAPPELEQDIVILDHALPGPEELAKLVREVHAQAKVEKPSEDVVTKAVDAISGLSHFAAEQVVAMSFDEDARKLDLSVLWERKRVAIEQTPGLGVWRGKETFADIIGLDAIKEHLHNQRKGRLPIGVGVWIDEIDKAFANVESDTSGVRTDQLKTLLTEMENNEWRGLLAVGVGGGGKSLLPKAFANEAGVPLIALDLAGMESKYVGESEGNLRRAIQVIKAIGRGNAYFIATSNQSTVMRPELQRRFTDGIWFFDLMTEKERDAAWAFYMKKYELPKQQRPDDAGWTGAEIRNCCRYAWNARCTLLAASHFVVPMSTSRVEEIKRLRQVAHNRMLDASRPGKYQDDARVSLDQQTKEVKDIRGMAIGQPMAIDPSGLKGMN